MALSPVLVTEMFETGPTPGLRFPAPLARGTLFLRKARGTWPRTRRRSYPELTWGQVAASLMVGILCASTATGRAESKPDWRTFRARLVEQEKAGGSRLKEAWVHRATLLEKGSVLVACGGDHFALDQQYFHKSVILIIKRDASGDVGVILNRPSDWVAEDLGGSELNAFEAVQALEVQLKRFLGSWMGQAPEEWNVSFGGPMCSGEDTSQGRSTLLCLHRLERLREGDEVVSGLFLLPFSRAQELVAMGRAKQGDFLLLSGYCGWGPGQLQEELRDGKSWVLAAAGCKAVLPKPGAAEDHWRSFLEALGQAPEESERADAALQRWISEHLVAPSDVPAAVESEAPEVPLRIPAGSLLRGSTSSWILGGPPELRPRRNQRSRPPAQYLHKAVLLNLADVTPEQPAVLVLLTGPKVGELPNAAGEVFFGGLVPAERQLRQISGGYIWGQVILPPGALQELLQSKALEESSASLQEVMAAPSGLRWAKAGGRLESINDAAAALFGDAQQKHWYSRYLGLAVEKLSE